MKKCLFLCITIIMLFSFFVKAEESTEYITEYVDEVIYDENFDYSTAYGDDENANIDIEESQPKSLKAVIINAGETYTYIDEYTKIETTAQDLKVKITDKFLKDSIFDVKYILTDDYYSSIKVASPLKEGDRVYVYGAFLGNALEGELYIQHYDKQGIMIFMVAIFGALIVLIGGKQGIKALISLILTVLAVFLILLPSIFNGSNPILVAVLVSVGIIAVTFIIVSGICKKTWVAIIGTSVGILIAGGLTILFGEWMKLTGLSEESYMLTQIPNGMHYDFKGIMFAGIVVGALGACMDIGMSIASAMNELITENPSMTFERLVKSGMNIGKDMMGTMTNTLILAYVGSALVYMLLFMGYDTELYNILNHEMIAEEILRSLAGSIGLVCTIPVTVVISALLMKKKRG